MTHKQYTTAGLILLVALGAFLFAQNKSGQPNSAENEPKGHDDDSVA